MPLALLFTITYEESVALDRFQQPHSPIEEQHCLVFWKIGFSFFIEALRSDCAEAPADLEVHCLHMASDKYCPFRKKI